MSSAGGFSIRGVQGWSLHQGPEGQLATVAVHPLPSCCTQALPPNRMPEAPGDALFAKKNDCRSASRHYGKWTALLSTLLLAMPVAATRPVIMDVEEKHPGITQVALTVSSIDASKAFMEENGIAITASIGFENMSAIFIRDLDRNGMELDAYGAPSTEDSGAYTDHAWLQGSESQ